MAEVYVSDGDTLLAGIEVTVFDQSGNSLNISGITDEQGQVFFRLPAGVYRFLAQLSDIQLQAAGTIVAHQSARIDLQRNVVQNLSLTLLKDKTTPLAGVTCTLSGLPGIVAVTDNEGKAVFPVEDGTYTITAHYLGGEFSSEPVVVPEVMSTTLLIEHQEVTITVYGNQGEVVDPLEGINCRLVLADKQNTSTGLSAVTNADGRVSFSVPLQGYRIQAEYMGNTFLSDSFDWYDSELYIPLSTIRATVIDPYGGKGGGSVGDIPVLLYSEEGVYLEATEFTDAYGEATLPCPKAVTAYVPITRAARSGVIRSMCWAGRPGTWIFILAQPYPLSTR